MIKNRDMTNLFRTKKYAQKTCLIKFLICMFFFSGINQIAFSQDPQKCFSNSFGNTFVHSNGNLTVFGEHEFDNTNDGTQPGIVGTERIPSLGYINFAPGSKWSNAKNTTHVDGYVRFFGNAPFVFPVGDNDAYRPCAISGGGYVEASYFGVNPTQATTSDIRGGLFPVLPATGPFNSNAFDDIVIKVSEYEYWDINGIDNTIISLTWNENSNVDIITSNELERLTIVGWDGSKWVAIPSEVDNNSITITDNEPNINGPASTLASGSISTKITLAPSDYEVYTLAASCINMTVEVPEEVLVCFGQPVTLTATSYEQAVLEWSTGDIGNTITAFPFTNNTYSVTATLGSCEVTESVDVTVKVMEVELGLDTFACSGNDMVIEAQGTFGGSYQWEHQGVNTFGNNILTLENLNTPSTVHVTITDSNGCTATDDVNIGIRQSPDVFTGRNASICQGDTTFLQAFGATDTQEYEWNTGDTGDLIYVGPMNTTTYEVSLTENGCTDVSFVTVEVFASAFVEIVTDSIVCEGEEVIIETQGSDGDFNWSTGETTPNITVTPDEFETFGVTVTTMGNCFWEDEITFVPYTSTIDIGEDVNICSGETVNLQVDGFFDSVLWSNGETTADINVTPTETTTYSATTTFRSCSAIDEVTIFVDESLDVNLGDDITICRGESVELSANAVGQYQWDTGDNSSSITVSPFATRTYKVTVTSGSCIGTDEITVIVSQEPAFIEITTNPLFCLGQELTIETNSSPGNVEWSTGETTPNINILPLNGQVYTVTTTNSNGCTASTSINFEAFADNQINLGEDKEICIGEDLTLEIEGEFETAIWSNNSQDEVITVSPLSTTTYSVTTTLNGCESTDEITINVIDIINIDLGEDLSTCKDEPVVLSVDNVSGNFTWSTQQTGNSITVFPSETTSYTVTVTSGNCQATDEITINVEEVFINIIGDENYCPGESITLNTDSSVGEYEWSTGTSENAITVTPSPGIEYSVTVTSPNGCSATDNIILNPVDADAVNLGPDKEICEGGTTTIELSGNFDSIEWGDGSTGNNIQVSPTNTTIYSVTATIGNCTNTDEITVNVVQNFSVFLGPDQVICDGESITLSTNSGGEFLWSTTETTPTIEVSPGAPQSYSVTVTSGLCSASDEIRIDVEETPEVVINGDPQICIGETTEIMADGPDGEYIWNNGMIVPTISITPAPDETYVVTFTSPNGCTTTENFTFESFSINSIDLGEDISVCPGEEVTINLEGDYDEILWSTGESTNLITLNPQSSQTISVTAIIGTCTSTDEINIDVLNTLELDLGSDMTICSGQSTILTGNVAGEYQWEHGAIGNNLEVNPTTTTTYIATVTSGTCTATDQITITVENEAYVNIISPDVYCEGQQVTLNVDGSQGEYEWSTGQNGQSITFAPTNGDTYHVTVTSQLGCVAYDSISLNVFANSNIEIGEDKTICEGESVELFVEGTFDELLWNDGTSNNPKTVTPTQTTTYSVVALFQGCESSDEITVNVNSSLDLNLGPDQNICVGEEVTLTTSIIGNYLWSSGETTQSITVSPNQSSDYALTITSGTCTTEDNINIFVDDSFVDIVGSTLFCEDEEVTVEAIGSGGTFLWSTGEETPSITLVPFENVSYRVTLTSPNGCQVEDEIIFTKFDNGDISLGPDVTICEGSSVDLMLTGDFDSVIWDDDNSTNPSRTVTPTQTTTYTITAQRGSCLSFDEITIFVLDNIDLNLGTDITICEGLSVEIGDANTGGNYLWSTGDTTSIISVTPSQTTTYSVTVTSEACVDSDEITVNIDNTCNVNLFVQKTVNDFNPKAGDTIEFTILVGNTGGITATNIEVSEEIRSGFNYISNNPSSGDYNVNTSLWYIDELAPNTTETLTILVEVLQNGDHSNIAEVTKVDQDEDDPDDDTVVIDIEVDIDVEDPDNTSEIGDYLWWDRDGDGVQNEFEKGFEGLKVELFSKNNLDVPLDEQETDFDGYFCFTGLSSGEYFLKFEIPSNHVTTLPKYVNDANQTFNDRDSDITNKFGPGTTNIINLGKNEQNKNVDGGLYPGGSIGDLVWKDAISGGRDNTYDQGVDFGFEGVFLELYDVIDLNDVNQDTLLATTVTDQNGNYRFGNLQKGNYRIKLIEPTGESLGQSDLDISDDIDNDFSPLTGRTDIIPLLASQDIDTIDAGLVTTTVPLTLVDFWGERIPEENFNRLFWITQSEANTDKFIIERSIGEAKNFAPIGEVEAAGNSVEELYYTFDDLDSRFAGQYYYRLRMLDLNGDINYSKIVLIVVEDDEAAKEQIDWKIFPVPTTDFLTIEIGLDSDMEFKGFLVNNLGQHVRSFETKQLVRGKNLHTIEVIDLAQGQYYLNFYVGEEQFIAKVLVLD